LIALGDYRGTAGKKKIATTTIVVVKTVGTAPKLGARKLVGRSLLGAAKLIRCLKRVREAERCVKGRWPARLKLPRRDAWAEDHDKGDGQRYTQ